MSWQRLGSAENGVGTPACRSHPLRRVLEAYLEETQRPLRKTGSDAGDRRPPRLSRPPSPSAGLSLAPRRPREPWFTGEVLSGRDAPARVSRQGQVSWRHRPGGGGIHPEATPSELRAREQRASWKVLYFIYQQHGGGKAQLQDPVITTSLGPLAGDGPSLHHSCPREVGMCPGPHKGARPLGEGALSAQRGPGWQVVHQSLAMPAEEGGLGTFRGPSPSQRVAATGLQAPKTLAYLLMGGVGDTRDLLPPHPQDPSPRWSCRTPPSQTRSSPQRRSPGRPGCGQGSPGVARAAGTAAG